MYFTEYSIAPNDTTNVLPCESCKNSCSYNEQFSFVLCRLGIDHEKSSLVKKLLVP